MREFIWLQTLKNEIVMRTTNTFGIQFLIRKNKAKDESAPIYARITVDGQRVEISLKRWINPTNWDTKKEKAIIQPVVCGD